MVTPQTLGRSDEFLGFELGIGHQLQPNVNPPFTDKYYIMLTKPEEIECVKNAWEPGIADPLRGREDFERIATCFFHDLNLQGARILDLGPGHYDFGHSLSGSGAKVVGYELDPAVIELGELKGFEVIKGNVYDLEHLNRLRGSFDGLFCRGSFNSRNFEDTAAHQTYLRALISVVKPEGFCWI